MTYYYTYKITCLLGTLKGKYYYGQHTTTTLDDKYCGSGRMIINYLNKYGYKEGETYTKEIIAFYNSIEELNQAEYELIGDKYKSDPMCLNLKEGGYGGEYSDESKKLMSLHHGGGHKKGEYHHSDETREKLKWSEERKKTQGQKHSKSMKGKTTWMKGKHQTDDAKIKIGNASRNRPKSKWMHLDDFEHKVYLSDIQHYLDLGYVLGRKINTHINNNG